MSREECNFYGVCKLKPWKNKEFKVSWKVVAKARAYSNLTKRCNLCIEEKYFIITNPQMATLNKRNELVFLKFLNFQMRFSRDNGQIMSRDYVDK